MAATRDILYLALTGPALCWGVPVEGFALNLLARFVAGAYLQAPTIWRSPFMFWAVALPIHYLMRHFTARDFHCARTLRLWFLSAAHPTLYSLPIRQARDARDIATAIVCPPDTTRISFQRRAHA